ncbi:MAG: hypothetical protein K8J31_25290 [Anaerolineae bacterium]|nr:hypothetical protein [Anaerolineae bacterium]
MEGSQTAAQLADLVLIALIGFGLFTALGIYAARRTRMPLDDRHPDVHLPLRFQGTGEARLEAERLIESTYRIDYQFPGDSLIKVELIQCATGDSTTILLKRGKGVDSFVVNRAGRHLLRVEPLREDVAWKFEIRPVGRRSSP